jgi:hypothetical protein
MQTSWSVDHHASRLQSNLTICEFFYIFFSRRQQRYLVDLEGNSDVALTLAFSQKLAIPW